MCVYKVPLATLATLVPVMAGHQTGEKPFTGRIPVPGGVSQYLATSPNEFPWEPIFTDIISSLILLDTFC